jgi:archaellum component FlaC
MLLPLCVASLFLAAGCTEKTSVALSVMRDKAENRLLALAGEGEVAIELHRQQYADLKERLVQLKTLLSQHRESLEQAYATDDARRIQIYTDLVTQLSDQIPKAESALREGHLAVETQREEVRRIRDEIASVRATGIVSDTLELESDFQKRAALIRELTESLRTKLRRAHALLEVNRTQETFSKP